MIEPPFRKLPGRPKSLGPLGLLAVAFVAGIVAAAVLLSVLTAVIGRDSSQWAGFTIGITGVIFDGYTAIGGYDMSGGALDDLFSGYEPHPVDGVAVSLFSLPIFASALFLM